MVAIFRNELFGEFILTEISSLRVASLHLHQFMSQSIRIMHIFCYYFVVGYISIEQSVVNVIKILCLAFLFVQVAIYSDIHYSV